MTNEAQEAPRPQMVVQAAEIMQAREMMNLVEEHIGSTLQGVIGQPNTAQTHAAAESDVSPMYATSTTASTNFKLAATGKFKPLDSEDERVLDIYPKAKQAFKDMDYVRCYEHLGELLETIKAGSSEEVGAFRTDGGILPNYVHIRSLFGMLAEFKEALHQTERMADDIERVRGSLEEFGTFSRSQKKEVDLLLDMFHMQAKDLSRRFSYLLKVDSRDGLKNDGNPCVEIAIDDFEDTELAEYEEGLSESQLLILELEHSRLERQRQDLAQVSRHAILGGDEVAPPLQGTGRIEAAIAFEPPLATNTGEEHPF